MILITVSWFQVSLQNAFYYHRNDVYPTNDQQKVYVLLQNKLFRRANAYKLYQSWCTSLTW